MQQLVAWTPSPRCDLPPKGSLHGAGNPWGIFQKWGHLRKSSRTWESSLPQSQVWKILASRGIQSSQAHSCAGGVLGDCAWWACSGVLQKCWGSQLRGWPRSRTCPRAAGCGSPGFSNACLCCSRNLPKPACFHKCFSSDKLAISNKKPSCQKSLASPASQLAVSKTPSPAVIHSCMLLALKAYQQLGAQAL